MMILFRPKHVNWSLTGQNLYLPQANLTIYQKGVYYAGIKIFNRLPIEIKNTSNNLKF
jgi:hypothetical protein